MSNSTHIVSFKPTESYPCTIVENCGSNEYRVALTGKTYSDGSQVIKRVSGYQIVAN